MNGNGDIRETICEIKRNSYNDIKRNIVCYLPLQCKLRADYIL